MTSPTVTMTRQEARLVAREPGSVVWGVLIPVVANLVLGLIPPMRTPRAELGGLSWSQVYLPTIILFALSILAVQVLPVTLAGYRESGVLRRLRTTPVSPRVLLAAVCTVLVAIGMATTAVLMLTPVVTGVGFPGNPLPLALTAVAALTSFVALGGLVTAVAPTARFATGLGATLTPILWFASGMWIPLPVMPGWLAGICELLPSGAAGRAMNAAMLGAWPTLGQLTVMAVWTLGCALLAARWFRWE